VPGEFIQGCSSKIHRNLGASQRDVGQLDELPRLLRFNNRPGSKMPSGHKGDQARSDHRCLGNAVPPLLHLTRERDIVK
jgi:hypothetical protein